MAEALQFENLCVDVGAGDEKKRILHNISGSVSKQSMLAVMGPTGGGKTTFLHSITNRTELSEGSVLYNGHGWSKSMKRRVGVVEQDDIVFANLTVRQTLLYSAALRLPETMTREEKEQRVEDVISALHMEKCSDTRVGDDMVRGISGGERKRLCIATELLTRPEILVCDEPTSGLDSSIAYKVMSNMQELAETQNMAIVVSIHQPSSHIFELFDQLLLVNEGHCNYYGKAADASQFFGDLGYACPPQWNPADHFMELLVEQKLENHREAIEAKFGKGDDRKNFVVVEQPIKEKTSDRYAVSFRTQATVLASRSWHASAPDILSAVNFCQYMGIALIVGLLWLNLSDEEADVFPRTAMLFWVCSTWSFFPLLGALPVFTADQSLIRRELNAGAYRLSAYFLSRSTTLIPMDLFWPTLYVPVVFWMTLPDAGGVAFVLFLLVIYLNVIVMQSMGLLISCAVNPARLLVAALIYITYLIAYSNFFMPLERVAVWLRWLKWTNPLVYTYQLALGVVLRDHKEYKCADASAFEVCDTNATFTNEDILDQLDITIPEWLSVLVLCVAAVLLRFVAYQFLRRSMVMELRR